MAKRHNPPMTDELYNLVMDRAQGRCEAAVPGVCTRQHPSEAHHRQLRSGGGKNLAENLAGVCHLCHGYFHRNPAEARENGWIVSKFVTDPGRVPMVRRGEPVILLADGDYQKVAA